MVGGCRLFLVSPSDKHRGWPRAKEEGGERWHRKCTAHFRVLCGSTHGGWSGVGGKLIYSKYAVTFPEWRRQRPATMSGLWARSWVEWVETREARNKMRLVTLSDAKMRNLLDTYSFPRGDSRSMRRTGCWNMPREWNGPHLPRGRPIADSILEKNVGILSRYSVNVPKKTFFHYRLRFSRKWNVISGNLHAQKKNSSCARFHVWAEFFMRPGPWKAAITWL